MIDFRDKDKRIYGPYFDGVSLRLGDPLKIYRSLLLLLDGDINKVLTEAVAKYPNTDRPDLPTQAAARTQICTAAVTAFELKPFDPGDGTGVTQAEAEGVFDTFLEWLENFERRVVNPPSSPTTTEGLISRVSRTGSTSALS
jgi:hypothetical protein